MGRFSTGVHSCNLGQFAYDMVGERPPGGGCSGAGPRRRGLRPNTRKGRLNEEVLEERDQIGLRRRPVIIGGQRRVTGYGPTGRPRGHGRGNQSMNHEVLAGSCCRGLGERNGSLNGYLLAPRLAKLGRAARPFGGALRMGHAMAATGGLGRGCATRAMSPVLSAVPGGGRTTGTATATAVLVGEDRPTKGFDPPIGATAGEVRGAGDQHHERRRPDYPGLHCSGD